MQDVLVDFGFGEVKYRCSSAFVLICATGSLCTLVNSGPSIVAKETLKLPKSFGNKDRIVSFAELKAEIYIYVCL
jgi:hypothetical protein